MLNNKLYSAISCIEVHGIRSPDLNRIDFFLNVYSTEVKNIDELHEQINTFTDNLPLWDHQEVGTFELL